jgi:hypothetical protein
MIASYSEIKTFCYAFVDYCNHLPTGILKEMHVYASITTNYGYINPFEGYGNPPCITRNRIISCAMKQCDWW